mmetsp:Transcript_21452/g.57727  ORF Transcript_21452/g.57727 Transcript_21452/m.57727 type:complete len:97 (-) Transcript_21452:197-487(-)
MAGQVTSKRFTKLPTSGGGNRGGGILATSSAVVGAAGTTAHVRVGAAAASTLSSCRGSVDAKHPTSGRLGWAAAVMPSTAFENLAGAFVAGSAGAA